MCIRDRRLFSVLACLPARNPSVHPMTTISIDGERLTLEQLGQAARGDCRFALDPAARKRVTDSRGALETILARGDAVYGANTGFGLLSDVRIPGPDIVRLQENLIRSHCAGVGPPLPSEVVRVMIVLRANVLARGHSGVRVDLVDALV